jgi:hypothetical protein
VFNRIAYTAVASNTMFAHPCAIILLKSTSPSLLARPASLLVKFGWAHSSPIHLWPHLRITAWHDDLAICSFESINAISLVHNRFRLDPFMHA